MWNEQRAVPSNFRKLEGGKKKTTAVGSFRQLVIPFSKHPLVTPPAKTAPDGTALTLF